MIKDKIKNYLTYDYLQESLQIGLKYLYSTDFSNIKNGKYELEQGVYAIVQEYQTKDYAKLESHKRYIDIQFLINGKEKIGYSKLTSQLPTTKYENDIVFYNDKPDEFIKLEEGEFVIFYPQDLHMPALKLNENAYVKKVVIKVPIE